MNYWLFAVTQKKVDNLRLAPDEVLKQRLEDRFWGLGERTPNRRALQRGDRVVFYVGIPFVTFAATATLASDSFALTEEQKVNYDHGKPFYRAKCRPVFQPGCLRAAGGAIDLRRRRQQSRDYEC